MSDLATTLDAAHAASIQSAFAVLVAGLADPAVAPGAPARFADAMKLADQARAIARAACGVEATAAPAPTPAAQPIVIRFVTCGDPVSAIIRRGELGFWASHVEALTPDGFLLGAHADGGVAKRPRDYDAGQWTLELYLAVPATPAQQAAFWAFLAGELGKPYDMAAIEAMASGALSGQATLADNGGAAWICSALIVAALIAAGLVASAPASVRLTAPRDVMYALAGRLAIDAPRAPKAIRPMAAEFDPFAA
jgi:hypothetical protein